MLVRLVNKNINKKTPLFKITSHLLQVTVINIFLFCWQSLHANANKCGTMDVFTYLNKKFNKVSKPSYFLCIANVMDLELVSGHIL